jgi:hypothetical protein
MLSWGWMRSPVMNFFGSVVLGLVLKELEVLVGL